MKSNLLIKFQPLLFIALLAGVMMSIFGYVGQKEGVTITGIVVTICTVAVAVVLEAYDEMMGKKQ